MDIETFREHCLAIEGATESTPFLDRNVIAFKVMDKLFCMASLAPRNGIFWADLKCDPDRSVALREQYEGIGPGHVKSALMWNRITLESDVPGQVIVGLIRHSVEEVLKKLPRAKRALYEQQS